MAGVAVGATAGAVQERRCRGLQRRAFSKSIIVNDQRGQPVFRGKGRRMAVGAECRFRHEQHRSVVSIQSAREAGDSAY